MVYPPVECAITNSYSVSTSLNSVSSDTPRHVVPSFDQRVTQWMSVVMSSAGSAMNSSHVQLVTTSDSVRMPKVHSGVAMRGVGPAESTGKSAVRY